MARALFITRQRPVWWIVQTTLLSLACRLVAARAEESSVNAPPDTLVGPWPMRVKIVDRGISPFAVLTLEAWDNAAGGLQRGGWGNCLLDFGVELDTAKLGWWQGGYFMAQAFWVQNLRRDASFADDTGAFNPVSSAMAGDQLRVFNLYYRHAWREDAVALKLGQIAVDDDFMTSDYSGLFLNSAFAPMPSQVGTPLASGCGNPPSFPIYSVAAPGVFVRVRPFEAFYTQSGLYDGRVGFDEVDNHGFDWASQSPAEVGLFWESGCNYRIGRRAAAVRLGISYHSGPLDDFSRSTAGNPSATRQTVPNFYLIQDLALVADREGKIKLGWFARGGLVPQPDRSMVSAYADTGLNWFAPLAARADDVAGIAVSHTRFSGDFRRSLAGNGVAADETTLELTYKAQVTRYMALQPDVQFLFNPAVNPGSGSRETAIVLGIRAAITF